jgi:hypothetical protein
MDAPFEWEAPDIRYGGELWDSRLDKLGTITHGWHDQDTVILEVRRLLASRRLNYTSQGAQCLNFLWREWPPENW